MDIIKRVSEIISKNDVFGKHNGIKLLEVGKGYAKTKMTVTENHLNAANITHGGAVFVLVDIAFAAAANSHGQLAVGLNMNINYIKPTVIGAVLTATATEDKLNKSTGLYRIVVEDEVGELVAVAEGLVYRKNESL